jgi:putative methyltransferase (TIGR04325 family)
MDPLLPPHLKRILLLLLPPIVVEAVRYLRWGADRAPPKQSVPQLAPEPALPESITPMASTAARIEPPEWEMVPDSDAVWSVSSGWAHDSIVETQRAKWPVFEADVESVRPLGRSHEASLDAPLDISTHNTIMTLGYVIGRVAHGRKTLSVLDWGRGLGHYFVYARSLYPDLTFDYVIKELPKACEVGRALVPQATFLADDEAALSRQYDLVWASSSVHYTRDCYGLLHRLCASASSSIMITRLPVVEHHDDFLVVQRPHRYGYMTEYPGWFMNKGRLLNFIRARRFDLVREFLVAEQPCVPNAPETARYLGFLFQRAAR